MTQDSKTERHYTSIFLEKKWAHHAHFGWTLLIDEPEIKILSRKQSVFTSYLVLLNSDDVDLLNRHVLKLKSPFGLSRMIIHDFKGIFPNAFKIGSRRFEKAQQSERLLNIATIAIDLTKSEEELFKAMSSDYRRKIRKAEKLGITIDIHTNPEENLIEKFVNAFGEFAQERGLNSIDKNQLEKMYVQDDALLLTAKNQGEISNYLHVYLAGKSSIFMYGVNPTKVNDGAGQYLHWQAMKWLKQNNYQWYDLGGVVSTDASDGIYNFKSKFGGQYINLGNEWYSKGKVANMLLFAKRNLRKLFID